MGKEMKRYVVTLPCSVQDADDHEQMTGDVVFGDFAFDVIAYDEADALKTIASRLSEHNNLRVRGKVIA